jgi:hypothetical protein
MEQVEENIQSAQLSGIHTLLKSELALLEKAAEKYGEKAVIPCTRCNYCMPCPNLVDIPRNFEVYNSHFLHEDIKIARKGYNIFTLEERRASSCIQCKICEEKCPQQIPISQWMPKIHEMLGKK